MAKPKHTLASVFEDRDSPTSEPPSPGSNVNNHRRQAARAAIKSDDKRLEDFNLSQDLQNIRFDTQRLPPEGAVSASLPEQATPNTDTQPAPDPSTVPEGWTRSADGDLTDPAGRSYKPLVGRVIEVGGLQYESLE